MERQELDKFLEEQIALGRIQPSESPTAAPVFFGNKKDGKLRFVQDYRKLNKVTIKNRYPIPLTSELLDGLKGARYFTKLDLRNGYNNVRIRKGDEHKLAFKTNRGLFEPTVMYFGMTNAPGAFQAMMNELLKKEIGEMVVIVYLDDILIFTKTLEQHREIVKRVLQALKDNDLYLKPEKCSFEQEKTEYLGMIISEGQVEMDKVKVDGVMSWPIPKKLKEVQAFLGFANFYRRFIQDFSEIAKPLTSLTKKDTVWRWGETQQQAFDTIKDRFCKAPVLKMPDTTKPFKLETDASNFAVGAVLSQQDREGSWHPVAYYSKSLNDNERNYEIYDKELGAIKALEEYRHYLEGQEHPVEIWTDHKNLEYFTTARQLTRRQARWSLFLSRFNYNLQHRPGKLSTKPDALSRRADHFKEDADDNKDQIMLKPEVFRLQATQRGHANIIDDKPLLKRIRESMSKKDNIVSNAVKELKVQGPIAVKKGLNEEYRGRADVVERKGLCTKRHST